MSDLVLISVIIPVYNVERYLNQCIESVINQSFSRIEIILVNDGSTDTSTEICNQWEKKDSRIKVIHQENKGLSGARNKGIEESSGKYLTFLDSDDWLNSDTLELTVKLAEEHEYDLVFWQMIKEYKNKSVYVEGPFGKDLSFIGEDMRSLHIRLTGPSGIEMNKPQHIDSFASAWGKLYKKSIIDENNIEFVDTKIIGSEDILFNFYYFHYCNSAYYLHMHLIHYRKDNPLSLTKTHGSTLFPRFLNLFSYLQDGINKLNLGGLYTMALKNRIAISMMNIGLSETSPRNSNNFIHQIKSLHKYILHPVYRNAYSQFSMDYLPVHWKLFFLMCKLGFSPGVYLVLKGMRLFIK
jgi:glycosyltransferase EpsH